MPDIYCKFCGEPWDIFELHDMTGENYAILSFADAAGQFAAFGCGAFDNVLRCCSSAMVDSTAAEHSAILQDLTPFPDEWIL